MRFNNKHLLEGSDEGEKFIGELSNYGNDKIKSDNHKNITSRK